MGYSNKVKTK